MVVSQGDKLLVGLHVTEYWMLIGRGRGVGYNRETMHEKGAKQIRGSGQRMGPVRIRHGSHGFGWHSPSHSVDFAGWQAKMASIEIWTP